MRRHAKFLAGFAVALTVLVGTVFVANRSVPGDVLYAMKTQVNEPTLTLLAFTTEGRTTLAMAHAESRLREIEQLAAGGTLDQQRADALTLSFLSRSAAAIAGIDELALTNAEAGAVHAALFAATLNAHITVLQKFTGEHVAMVLANVSETQTRLAVIGNRATRTLLSGRAGADLEAAAGRAMRLASGEIETLQKHAAMRVQTGMHAAGGEDLQLSVAQDALAAARVKSDAKSFSEAFELALRARAQAVAAKVMVDTLAL